jgi:peptidoglycan/LPS O-acetylase OafA/YrhL
LAAELRSYLQPPSLGLQAVPVTLQAVFLARAHCFDDNPGGRYQRGYMRRLDFVDSLRGLAAIYVVVYHMVLLPDPNLLVPHWADAIAHHGGTAVRLFFVISAFSLCHTMKEHTGRGQVRDFYIRRFFRIAPLFYFMLVFYAFRDVLYFGVWHSPWLWLKSVLFFFNFFPDSASGIVWASWTIGVEMVFYAVFPLLFPRYRNAPALVALLFATLLMSVVYHEYALHLLPPKEAELFYGFSFFRSLPCFVIGMLCWFIYDRYIDGRKHSAELGLALILGSLWAFHALLQHSMVVWFPDDYYWQAIIYSALLLGVGIKPLSIFVNRLTRFAGKASYSIYLLHPSTILFLFPVYRWIYGLGFPVTVSFLASYAVTLTAVISLSALTYRWIEKPGMRLGKLLIARLSAGYSPSRVGTTAPAP